MLKCTTFNLSLFKGKAYLSHRDVYDCNAEKANDAARHAQALKQSRRGDTKT